MPPAPTTTKTLTASSDTNLVDQDHSESLLKTAEANSDGHIISNGKFINTANGYSTTATATNGSIIKNGNITTTTMTTTTKTTSILRTNGKLKPEVEEEVEEEDEVEMHDLAKLDIVWRNVAIFVYLHLAAVYGAYLWVTGQVMWQTFLWGFKFYVMSGFGITAGTHRLWAHKSYKAKIQLRILLCYMQTVAFQNSIYEWCRDHRVHHKYTETNADPHNAKRGFFFAHMGWLMARKDKAVRIKGKGIDMSDLEKDPVVVFQRKYYLQLVLACCFIIPTLVPWLFWGESLVVAYFFAAMFRYCATLHCTWLVNSAAHLWGPRPYDKRINPAENKTVSWWAFGEGWHNYHHVFPWDYKTAEVGVYRYNFSAAFIDFMAKIGWAYDLKTVPEAVVKQRVARTGDGSHDHFNPGPWGWGDGEIPTEHAEVTEVLYRLKSE